MVMLVWTIEAVQMLISLKLDAYLRQLVNLHLWAELFT